MTEVINGWYVISVQKICFIEVEPQSQNSFDSIDTPVDRLKKVIDCKDFNKQPEDRNPSLLLPSSFVSARKKSAGRQERGWWSAERGGKLTGKLNNPTERFREIG